MANIKSKIKRMKQSIVAGERNKQTKTLIKTKIKQFNSAVESKDAKKAQEIGSETIIILDKAVSKGVIHANKCASNKSAIASALHKLGSKPVKSAPKKQTTKKKTKEQPVKKDVKEQKTENKDKQKEVKNESKEKAEVKKEEKKEVKKKAKS